MAKIEIPVVLVERLTEVAEALSKYKPITPEYLANDAIEEFVVVLFSHALDEDQTPDEASSVGVQTEAYGCDTAELDISDLLFEKLQEISRQFNPVLATLTPNVLATMAIEGYVAGILVDQLEQGLGRDPNAPQE